MLHGEKDEVVPLSFSKKTLSIFTRGKKKLLIIKKGDHSLSDKRSINIMKKELYKIVHNVF